MAQIMGFQLKNIKTPLGREGYGCIATMYLDGKRIGTYTDYGDGAMENVEYIDKEKEEKMMRRIIEFAKTYDNEFIIQLYKDRPEQYQETCERFRKQYPYIPEKDITIQTMASNSIVYIVDEFLKYYEYEKLFKKGLKQGYRAIGVKGDSIYSIPQHYTDEQINALGYEQVFTSLDDFVA